MVYGGTFCERRRTRVSFEDYGGSIMASSLRHHMEIIHCIVLP